jgi:hypothetical protein
MGSDGIDIKGPLLFLASPASKLREGKLANLPAETGVKAA